jgi:hypothetical protein
MSLTNDTHRGRGVPTLVSKVLGAGCYNFKACALLHNKQAKIHGKREPRLYHLASWRDSTLFAPYEHAALAWTDMLTKLPEQGVPDEIYERERTQLSEKEISDLTFIEVRAVAACPAPTMPPDRQKRRRRCAGASSRT